MTTVNRNGYTVNVGCAVRTMGKGECSCAQRTLQHWYAQMFRYQQIEQQING
ncbi:MAG: hypothetical protein U1B30_15065 [Pseudomonadota bacterium]|nr:hypothetical protein [Pseudomonadota bacterium]